MAAPIVTGAAAMLIDQNSAITPDQVKAKLMRTAWRGFPATMTITVTNPAGTFVENADIFSIGAGQVDIWAAYNDTTMPSGSAASPVATFSSRSSTVKLQLNSVGASNVIWGSTSPFATNVIWGSNVSGTNVIWGSNVIWGANTILGANVIWGSSSPWAQSTPGAELLTVAINGDN